MNNMCFIMKKKLFQLCWLLTFLLVSISFADVQVRDVSVKPHYPWNGLIDITYSILCGETYDDGEPVDISVSFKGYDTVCEKEFPMTSLTGKGGMELVKTGGPYMVTWNAAKDYPTLNSSAFSIRIHATYGLYMVINLSEGPTATHYPIRYSAKGPDLDKDTCRTTELWLRRISAGKFIMGSPSGEVGRHSYDMTQHEVTLTQAFYIGVFECTQRQWELVMGNNPSGKTGECRPVNCVSYVTIRGNDIEGSIGWPQYGHAVDPSSFMGKLQAKTGLTFDMPTEAQWEYACRAGTTTALNSGKDWSEENMKEVERCAIDEGDGKGGYNSGPTKVGSYLPNAWGLYDMLGNVWERCLDRWEANMTSMLPVEDSVGPEKGNDFVIRGGSYNSQDGWGPYRWASWNRSASRLNNSPTVFDDGTGFRIACHLDNP